MVLFMAMPVHGQSWFHQYGDSLNSDFFNSREDYDKGFLFTGYQWDQAQGYAYGWLVKTDINGNQLWAKSFGFPGRRVAFYSIANVPGGGNILAGYTNKRIIQCTDPFIVKVNVCGEKEWCRIYKSQDCNSACQGIVSLSDGSYIALMGYWKNFPVTHLWLLKLDNSGNIIWQQAYATDPEYRDEVAYSLMMTMDSSVVITGNTYYADSLFPGNQVLKFFLVKTGLDGNVIFDAPWGKNMGIISDAMTSIEGNAHALYTAGRRAREGANSGDSPCLFKTSGTGQSLYYNDILDSTQAGNATAISSFSDGTLAFSAQWWYSTGLDTTGIFKTDTLGNVMNRKIITTEMWCAFFNSFRTFSDRQVFSGVINQKGVALKLNSDLEYDSIYTAPFTYDSLCPHAIATDTVPMDDCTVITDIYEPEKDAVKTKLLVYPNPANSQVAISPPEFIVRESKDRGLTVSTVYYKWSSAKLQVIDLGGRVLYSQEISDSTPVVHLETGGWKEGLYMARLLFMNETVASARFMVAR